MERSCHGRLPGERFSAAPRRPVRSGRRVWTLGWALVLALVVVLEAPVALGQPETEPVWDAERYMGLVNRSNYLFELANELPETEEERRQLLIESSTLKQQAIDMLRQALLGGELDDYGERPRTNLYHLYQNIVVLLAELDFCRAAEVQLETALQDEAILPPDTREELRALRGRIDECDDRTAAGVPTAGGEVSGPAGGETGEGGGQVATPGDEGEDAQDRDGGSQAAAAAGGEDREGGEAEGSDEAAAVDGDGDTDAGDTGQVDGDNAAVAWIVMGTGVALIASGLVYDVALAGKRDDFATLRDACFAGSCDYDQAESLQSDLETGRIVIATTVSVGLAAAIVGGILLATGGGDESGEPSVGVGPVPGVGAWGVGLSGSF